MNRKTQGPSGHHVDERGRYGPFGGAFIPEMLVPNTEALRERYLEILASPSFCAASTRRRSTTASSPSGPP